jgi:hypothetical protein
VTISRAQIPEQIDVFATGGEVSPADIIALMSDLKKDPVTAADVLKEQQELAKIFPQPRKKNFFDLASEIGAGLVSGASSPGGFGVGLTAGLQAFNESVAKREAERDKMRQELTTLAYKQVQQRRDEQMALAQDLLEKKYDLALESGEEVNFGSSTLGKALAYIVRAEKNPKLKESPEYKIAVAIAQQDKTSIVQTEQGASAVTVPGLDIEGILKKAPPSDEAKAPGTEETAGVEDESTKEPPLSVIQEDGVSYSFTGRYTADGKPIYVSPEGVEGTF